MSDSGSLLVVGIGSDHGDDRAGPLAARRLAAAMPDLAAGSLRHPADLLDLLDRFEGLDGGEGGEGVSRLHVIDACRGLGAPGTIRRADWPAPELASLSFGGSHDLDLAGVLRLAERLQLLPRQTTIWCIAAGTAEQEPLSEPSLEVAAAVERVVQAIAGEIGRGAKPHAEGIGHA